MVAVRALPAAVAFGLVTLTCALAPLWVATWRRARSELGSALALRLRQYAWNLRRAQTAAPLDDETCALAVAVGIPEFPPFAQAAALGRLSVEQLAQAADRLALRVRRRVAFDRKMLARTANGRRRSALAALIPVAALFVWWEIDEHHWRAFFDWNAASHTFMTLSFLQALGGALSWRLAHVEI